MATIIELSLFVICMDDSTLPKVRPKLKDNRDKSTITKKFTVTIARTFSKNFH